MPRVPAPVLRTERLLLRAPRERDAAALCRLGNHPAVYRQMGSTSPDSVSAMRDYIRRHRRDQRAGTRMGYVLTLRSGREVAGWCTVEHLDVGHGLGEIGFWLGRPYWGRGLMVEGGGAVLAHLFEGVGVFRVSATVFPSNRRSKATLARLGFRREGVLRKHYCREADGVRRDMELHALLRTDVAARHLVRNARRG